MQLSSKFLLRAPARSSSRVAIAMAATFLMIAFLSGRAMAAGGHRYDPATCKEDAHGKLYIALGRSVLAVPSGGAVVVGEIYPSMKYRRFPAPDPDDPLGCRGNPEQLQSYAWIYDTGVVRAVGDPPPKTYQAPDLLQLIRIPDEETRSSIEDISWSGENIDKEMFIYMCNSSGSIHEFLDSGFHVCRIPRSDPNIDKEDWAAYYMSDIKRYKTPSGGPLYIDCDTGLHTNTIGNCETAYAMTIGFGIFYRFQPYLGPHPISIDRIIDFDRSLQLQIETSLIADYVWPDAAIKTDPHEGREPNER